MHEKSMVQSIPVKVYRSTERLMVAAPMPGLQLEDIVVKVTGDNHIMIHGDLRGVLKDIKELLIDEWSVGSYHRELVLPNTVDAEHGTVTYGNGVVVVALPLSEKTIPATVPMS